MQIFNVGCLHNKHKTNNQELPTQVESSNTPRVYLDPEGEIYAVEIMTCQTTAQANYEDIEPPILQIRV